MPTYISHRFKYEPYNYLMTILATKVHVPVPRSRMVSRARLMDQLNAGLERKHKLTLISAPAGFGKTTLASEWVLSFKQPVAWLSLDGGDGDLKQFLLYLIAALKTIIPEVGTGVMNMLQSSHVPEIEPLLTTLLNEIDSGPHDFMLVLDDYHILDSKPVDQALNFLVGNLPPQIHLVITTREDPSLPLARLRARGQLTELRTADLRFTSAEAAEFLNQVMGLTLSAEQIAALEVRTEGWIAGLQLAALSMQGLSDVDAFIKSFTGAHHFVLDYLLEEVLHQQPENIQAFLLNTSILNRLCGSLCDAVLLDPSISGQVMLESLERANLFIVSLDNERHWYRYHHLFGDLLRQRQGQNRKPEELASYHIRASEWYEQNHEEAEAFQHAVAAEDFNLAIRLAEKFWQGMNQSFQSATWLGWVKQLPESLIRTRPVLCTQLGWAFMDMGDIESSESSLRDAELCLETSAFVTDEKEAQTLPARIAFARAYNAQARRDFPATVKYAELAIELAPKGDPFMRAGAAAILGGTYWARGDLDSARKSMSDWIDSSLKAGNYIFSIASESGNAEIQTAQGYLREALRTYEQSLQHAAAYGNEVKQILAHHYLGVALLHHEMGNDESAAQSFQQSMELGEQSTLVDFPYRRSLAQARFKESAGDFDSALAFLDEASRLFISTPIPNTRPVEALKARIYLKHGQLSKAQAWARECGINVSDELSYLREFEHITLAQVLVAEYQSTSSEDKIQAALGLLSRLLQTAEDAKRMGSMIEILTAQALAFRAHGDARQAHASLSHALTLAEPEGYFRFFVNEGKPMAELLAQLSQSHVDDRLTTYIRKLLNASDKTRSEPASPQSLIDPLSERELEVLHLVADGLSNDEISQKLFLALSTVKGHNLRIFGKLQAKSRTEAVARARELGLL